MWRWEVSKMALIEKLRAIGDAIRAKTGGTDPLTLDGMAAAIAGIQAGGGGADVSEVTLTTSFDTAGAASPILSAMASHDYTLFIYTGESTAENQIYAAVIDKTVTMSGGHMINYNRYRSGTPAIVGGIGYNYTLIGSVGDTFLMIGGDAP